MTLLSQHIVMTLLLVHVETFSLMVVWTISGLVGVTCLPSYLFMKKKTMSRYWLNRHDDLPELFQMCEECGALIPDKFWGPENARKIHEQWHERFERS